MVLFIDGFPYSPRIAADIKPDDAQHMVALFFDTVSFAAGSRVQIYLRGSARVSDPQVSALFGSVLQVDYSFSLYNTTRCVRSALFADTEKRYKDTMFSPAFLTNYVDNL